MKVAIGEAIAAFESHVHRTDAPHGAKGQRGLVAVENMVDPGAHQRAFPKAPVNFQRRRLDLGAGEHRITKRGTKPRARAGNRRQIKRAEQAAHGGAL